MKYFKRIIQIVSIFMMFYILLIIFKNQEIVNVIFSSVNIEKIGILLIILVVFLVIHIVRMFRIYILLIEEKMPLAQFVKIYLKTTFVNNIIPFKLGEFYKMICYGEKLKSFSAGLSLIWLDRFFDSVILLALMSIASGLDIFSPVYIILVGFIVFSILAYTSFESTYKYFNTLVLEKGISKRSKLYLEIINEVQKIFKRAKKMLSFRGTLLVILSVIIWIFEYLLAYLTLHVLFNMEFGLNIFNQYINSAFMILGTEYITIFIFNIIIMIIIFTIIYLCLKLAKKGVKV